MTPFKEDTNTINTEERKSKNHVNGVNKPAATDSTDNNKNSLYDRLYNRSGRQPDPPVLDENVIDSTTLDNVSVISTDNDASSDNSDSDSDSDDSSSDSVSTAKSDCVPPPKSRPTVRLDVQCRLFDALINELKDQERKTYSFRAIPRKWENTQMCNLFLTQHNTPEGFDLKKIYIMRCESINENDERVFKEFYVNIKSVQDNDAIPKNIYPTIEMNDILMAHLNARKYSRITLITKKTVINFVEKIEVIPAINSNVTDLKEIEEGFKHLLVSSSRFSPVLLNQDQIFKVCDGDAFVKVKIYPDSFRYCLCDAEILRENKIFMVEQARDLTAVLQTADEITNPKEKQKSDGTFSMEEKIVDLDVFMSIEENCCTNVVKNLCLDDTNALRKMYNIIITGVLNIN